MKKYPSFFLDSKKVTEKRKIAQREKGDEDFYSSIVCRPFTIFFSLFFVKYTSIKANHITYVMALLSIAAPIIIYFIDDKFSFFLWSFLFYFIILFLDVLDGEVARMRKETSELGVYIDSLLWFTLDALLAVFLLKVNSFYFQLDYLVPLIIVLPFVKLFTKAGWVQYIIPLKKSSNTAPNLGMSYYIRALFERPSIHLYFLIVVIAEVYFSIDVLYLIYALFALMIAINVFTIIKKNRRIITHLKGL